MRHVEGRADLGQTLISLLGFHPVTLRGRRDAERPQQVSRRSARVAGLA
jgi:hypothetical protein